MDDVKLERQKNTNSQCIHGKCLNHEPDWEKVDEVRLEPNPSTFGMTVYMFARHCGASMARYKKVQTQKCRICGHTENLVENGNVAMCLCCGYNFTNVDW